MPLDGLAPADEAGVASAVRAAHDAHEPLLVGGRGTKAGMLRPVQAARSLSTRALTGLTLHAPQELIVSVRAGTTVPDLEAALDKGRQWIISEPPDLSAILGEGTATIGGIVATNLSGPRRVAWGATRDHVMGLRAVNGVGDVLRCGGRVLKNVTGLDMCKLLAGSHGTLGVITEVTLKVLPRSESSGSVMLRGLDPVAAVAALSAALGSPYTVSGAAYVPTALAGRVMDGAGSVTLVRIEDFTPSVVYRLGRLATDLAQFGAGTLLDDATSQAAWRAIRDAVPLRPDDGDAVWRVSVRPSAGPGVLAVIEAAGGHGYLDWGGGLVWVAGPPSIHEIVRQAAGRGTWMVLRAPEPMRAAIDVVPPEAQALAAITRRVKAAMDPRGILNPGRLFAGV